MVWHPKSFFALADYFNFFFLSENASQCWVEGLLGEITQVYRDKWASVAWKFDDPSQRT